VRDAGIYPVKQAEIRLARVNESQHLILTTMTMFRKFQPLYDDMSTPGGGTSDGGENNTPSTPSTPENGASTPGSEGAAPTTPSGINVGGREYTPQELEQKLKSLDELNKGYTTK